MYTVGETFLSHTLWEKERTICCALRYEIWAYCTVRIWRFCQKWIINILNVRNCISVSWHTRIWFWLTVDVKQIEIWSNLAYGSLLTVLLSSGHDISDWSVPCTGRYSAEHEHSVCHFLQEQDNKATILPLQQCSKTTSSDLIMI